MTFNPHAIIEQAMRHQSVREYAQAKATLLPLIKRFPKQPDVNYLYATILSSLEEYQAAIAYFKEALKGKPELANCWNDLGCVYKSLMQYDDAIATFEKAVSLPSHSPLMLVNLSSTFYEVKNYQQAAQYITKAIEFEPNKASSYLLLGNIQKANKQYADAITTYGKAIHLDEKYCQAYFNLALALKEQGKPEQALEQCSKVLLINKTYHQALMLSGELNEQIGDIDLAITYYKQCLVLTPHSADAYWSLANLGKESFSASNIAAMLELTKQSLSDKNKMYLFFSLAKAMEEKQDYASSFDFLQQANKVKRRQIAYKADDIRFLFDKLRNVFTQTRLEECQNMGYEDISPIFIVGMPRSGTSLIEQILASHSAIAGGGELETSLNLLFDELPRLTGQDWSSSLNLLDENILTSLGKEYQGNNRELISRKERFTDKLPFNFALIGFLSLVFPKAKFIHIFKHPLDSCLSCYKQLFSSGQEFSYDLDEIADYYQNYQDIMQHWSSVLESKILHVNYETLVESPSEQVDKMLTFLSLPWQEECLNFHKNKRIVKTASSGQVRQGLYTSSVSRWKNYRQQLLPISQKLTESHAIFNDL